MIFFCEDCGAKNSLKPEQIVTGRAIFRCNTCDYSNNYLLPSINQKSRIPLKKQIKKNGFYDFLLNKINALSEVTGSFVYHFDKGILVSKMPGEIREEELLILAAILSENYLLCDELYPDINRVILFLKDKIVVLRQLRGKIFIAVAVKTFPFSESFMLLMEQIQNK